MFGNSIAMMDKSMDCLWKRQEIVADNIANVDTPGYKKKRIEFEETFRSKLRAAADVGKRDDVKQAIQSTGYHMIEEPYITRADGNGVNADVEYTDLARTTLHYQYLAKAVSDDITRYRSAIKGQ